MSAHIRKRKQNLSAEIHSKLGLKSKEKESVPVVSMVTRTARDYDLVPWTLGLYSAFKILLTTRLFAAVWNIVGDCDETFNYWEPLHFILYGKGFQTWEYSPAYALRSYAYIWLYAFPLKIYTAIFGVNKVLQFYLLRCLMAVTCALCEIYFYRGVCKHYGNNVGRLMLMVLLTSAGMFISSSAFLPSSFAMYMTFLSVGAWYQRHYEVAIVTTAASAILGWPFAGALGIPIAIDILFFRKRWQLFMSWSLFALILFMIPMMQMDKFYYGKLVIAPLNIIMYNVFTSHGPDLYGVEPFSYYFVNGFLNFNVIFLLALVCLPFVIFVNFIAHQKKTDIPIWLAILPMYIWIAIFFTRPHKEERFLFPIYPFFALCGALTLDYMQRVVGRFFTRSSEHYADLTAWLPTVAIGFYSVLAVSRMAAVYQGYHAPLDVYLELNRISSDPKIHTLSPDKPVHVCVGKEWYRFPGNFFLPDNNWNLHFVQSEFKGQLPKPYSSGPNATAVVHNDFNDLNKEEPSRYIDVKRCHYMIDLDLPNESPLEPRYSQIKEDWKVLFSMDFIDAQRSHRFFRAFFIPFISKQYSSYVNYNVLKTTRTKRKAG